MNSILPVQQRLAELWVRNQRIGLTDDEVKELDHCMKLNWKYVWRLAFLENMSLMASMTNDVDWHFEVCRDIDELNK
jgi:hypothetical protein